MVYNYGMINSIQCKICGKEITSSHSYCQRCKGLLRRKPDITRTTKTRALLSAIRNHEFHCHYTGIPLLTNKCDKNKARYLTFDHRTPRNNNDIVTCAALINDMKSDMNEDEFKNAILEVAKHFQNPTYGVNLETFDKLRLYKR